MERLRPVTDRPEPFHSGARLGGRFGGVRVNRHVYHPKEGPLGILDTIRNPQDLNKLSEAQLDQLAAEVRGFLIGNVSQTGGHLGPNLGVVELTIAVHRIFDSPRDSIVFDTGHQSYVHKLPPDARISAPFASRAACPATRTARNPSMTSSKAPTPPPRCPGPTAFPAPGS
jgi:hypothetical protein